MLHNMVHNSQPFALVHKLMCVGYACRPLGFAGAMASIAVELGFGLPGLMIYDQFKDKPCDDGDILSYVKVNGVLGLMAAILIFVVTCCAYAPIFVSDEENRPARGTLLNLCCVLVFYAAHFIMLIYGSVVTWSSNCRTATPDLFEASRRYSIAGWVLFLGGLLFLATCYCLGAVIDIFFEERALNRARLSMNNGQSVSAGRRTDDKTPLTSAAAH